MKILVLLPFSFFRTSGSPLNSYYRIRALLELENQIDIATYPHGQNIELDNLKIYRLPKRRLFKTLQPGELFKKFIYEFFLFFNCLRLIIINKYDLVIAHGTIALICIIFKPFIKAKFVATIHGNIEEELSKWNISKNKSLFGITSKLEALPLRYYDKILTVTPVLKDKLLTKGLLENRIITINNSTFSKPYIPYASTNRIFKVLYSGTFVKVQNLDLLYRTAEILKSEDVEFLLIGGNQKEIAENKGIVSNLNLKNITLVPRIEPKELEQYYRQADIVVSPRVYGHAEIPQKIYDYLNFGKCILAADVQIHRNLLTEENSILVKPFPGDFADAIRKLIKDPALIAHLGQQAKETFEASYSFVIMKSRYQDLLSELSSQ